MTGFTVMINPYCLDTFMRCTSVLVRLYEQNEITLSIDLYNGTHCV